jgi:hypothetical protein
MTGDGVGVLAPVAQFGRKQLRAWTYDDAVDDFITEADAAMQAKVWGAALYSLKEAWWHKYWDAQRAGKQREIRDRMIEVYGNLGKTLLAETMRSVFDWVK